MGPQRVEEAHQRVAEILTLTVGGRQIQTTTEHPFWVKDRGRIEACDLQAGDELSTSSGEWVTIEKVVNDGTVTTVYNMTVELWHTYFVGEPTWGFDIWVHNNHNLSPHKIGRVGEILAEEELTSRGWNVVHTLSHGNQGVDIIAQKVIGGRLRTIVVEVKANGSRLSVLQKLGADGYAKNVLNRLGGLENLSPSAKQAKLTLQNMILNNEQIHGVVIKFDWRSGTLKEIIRRWLPNTRV